MSHEKIMLWSIACPPRKTAIPFGRQRLQQGDGGELETKGEEEVVTMQKISAVGALCASNCHMVTLCGV